MGEWKPFHEGCGNNKRISNEVRGILEDKNLKYFKAMTQDAAENVKLTFLRRIDARISLSVGRTEEGRNTNMINGMKDLEKRARITCEVACDTKLSVYMS